MNRLDITTVKWQKCHVYILTRTTANIYIFRKIIGQNLQRFKENWNNIKFYWINFVTSLLFLCKQCHNPRLKFLITICSLIQLTIVYHVLSISFNRFSVIVKLKDSHTNEFLTIEVLYIANKMKEFSTDMHSKLLTINKMKSKSYYLYLKMTLVLSRDINLNPGSFTRHQINDPRFEVFNSKGLRFTHLNINSFLPEID